MRSLVRWVIGAALVALAGLGAPGAARGPRVPARMADAAAAWLKELSPELRARAQLSFDDAARRAWHFVPKDRAGVPLKEMNDAQRRGAQDLLRASLSARGALKVAAIMQLDSVLREMEKHAGGDGAGRDPERYFVAVWGKPGEAQGWGWRLEGHHISLNFTVVAGSDGAETVAVTPAFLGAHPAEVGFGPTAGVRVLSAEEDLGRELVESLNEGERAKAIINTSAPADIIWGPGRAEGIGAPAGLAASEMDEHQLALLEQLIGEYTGNFARDAAEEQLERIRRAGIEKVRFAWAGGVKPGEGHYYRIHGPTFIIEYDNTQNGANHVHTVWHDLDRDFGEDLLRAHYEREHQRK